MINKKAVIFLPALLFNLVFVQPALCSVNLGSDLDSYLYPETSQKTISMDFKDAQLNDVLKIFSQQSGMNFIASNEVADKMVNLYLDNVGVEEALERILSANDLTYEIKPGSNIFIVKEILQPEKKLLTRVFPLKYATVPSSKINTTLSKSADSSSQGSSSQGSSSQGSSSQESSKSPGIVSAVEAILTESGSVVEDTRTNSLIVSDIQSQFPLIEQTITRLDVRIPQILIEVEMLDISKTTSEQLGAKFGSQPFSFSGPTKQGLWPFNKGSILSGETRFENTFNSGGEGESTGQYTPSTISFSGLNMALNFLKTKTDTRNLARPRILTLNNETAVIQIKTDEAIGISQSSTSSEGTSSSTIEAERVETGVFLKVTPQISLNTSEITLAIEPKVIQARTGETFPTQNGNITFRDPEERGSKSILRIKDGDTIIIGGLLRNDLSDTRTNVPFLEKLPLFGAAFRHKEKKESERELVIFITPHILKEDQPALNKSLLSSNIVREQDLPSRKLKEIDKELSILEKKGL
ncbi:MAG TPA: hypothetical protein DD723_08000 [Candidatus Omnitrophica bacterium]|nr:MAG: hypothetical protein A2Z81_07955 [Omnitrophica WOR_2 bacterium GWA2_45_18]OGX19120.1 MAG: hypothetical protein A2Y04_02680 [Omnitrophica WOR_2 bacterium GWC2_45_7]HBR15468.1 hypothetical protein [Candidatus Omnitrophota bacterium]